MRHSLALTFGVVALAVAAAAQSAPRVDHLGGGCGAAGAGPVLAATAPVLGRATTFALSEATPGTAGFLNLTLGPAAPVPIGPCTAHVDPAAVVGTVALVVGAGGRWALDVPVPASASLSGVHIAAQAVLHPTAGPLGVDVSDGILLTLGPPHGPLAGMPSPPGPHIAAIAALGDDAWLDLGVPAADPAHGLATGREYTPRMAWASDLKGAFLTGEGEHGYVDPATRRYVDDVWFYDLPGNRWVCVKPGSHVDTLSLALDRHDFEVDASGQPVPVAQLGHGYEFVTYDEARGRFFMQPCPNTYWVPSLGPRRLTWLLDPNLPLRQIHCGWVFDAAAGRWDRRPVGTPVPAFNHAARAMAVQYLPSQHAVWLWDTGPANRRKVWLFDTATFTWRDVDTVNDGPAVQGHGVTCHDPVHDRVYYYGVDASGTPRLWRYDVAARRWSDTGAAGVPPARVIYTTAFAGMTYDVRGDRVLMKGSGSGYPVFHVYDPATNAFDPTPVVPPPALQPYFRWAHVNACYAPEFNVHVLHVAPSGSGTGRVLVYRYRR